jgi:hypothetical protein
MKRFIVPAVLLLVGASCDCSTDPTIPRWSASLTGSVIEVGDGSGTEFPQYAALHTESGYFRMNYGPGSGWGTSVVVLPSFWSGGTYHQGGQTSATWTTERADLVISFSASLSGLSVQGQIRLAPPAGDSLSATVSATVEGTVVLDQRPGEAFKPVMLSSMHVSPGVWDTESAFVDSQPPRFRRPAGSCSPQRRAAGSA